MAQIKGASPDRLAPLQFDENDVSVCHSEERTEEESLFYLAFQGEILRGVYPGPYRGSE